MAAVNSRKKLYVLLKGPFTEIGINEYLRYLIYVEIYVEISIHCMQLFVIVTQKRQPIIW